MRFILFSKPQITVFALVIAFCSTGTTKADPWLDHPQWDDGKAEVSTYSAERFHYGRLYPSEVIHYLVKETFSKTDLVKMESSDSRHARDPHDAIDVIKLNQVVTTPTGSYTYHQMHSAFWNKKDGALLKFTVSHHEACGASYQQGLFQKGIFHFTAHTYWQDRHDVRESFEWSGSDWFHDELPVQLRRLVAGNLTPPKQINLWPGTLSSRAPVMKSQPAVLEIKTFTARLRFEDGSGQTLTFSPDWPHVLTEWKQQDGSSLKLLKTQRLDYWNFHQPGDEKRLRVP